MTFSTSLKYFFRVLYALFLFVPHGYTVLKEIIREQKAVFEAEGPEGLVEQENLKKVSESLRLPHILVISGQD